MRVIVIGGRGFLGSRAVACLERSDALAAFCIPIPLGQPAGVRFVDEVVELQPVLARMRALPHGDVELSSGHAMIAGDGREARASSVPRASGTTAEDHREGA